jgi:hypothetical protein
MPESREYDRPEGQDQPESQGSGAARAKERVEETLEKTREKAAEAKDAAMSAADEKRGTVASKLEGVAERAREKAPDLPGGERSARAAEYVADKAEQTAGYIRAHTTSEMVGDVENVIRRHPMQALFGALVVGFFIGRSMQD